MESRSNKRWKPSSYGPAPSSAPPHRASPTAASGVTPRGVPQSGVHSSNLNRGVSSQWGVPVVPPGAGSLPFTPEVNGFISDLGPLSDISNLLHPTGNDYTNDANGHSQTGQTLEDTSNILDPSQRVLNPDCNSFNQQLPGEPTEGDNDDPPGGDVWLDTALFELPKWPEFSTRDESSQNRKRGKPLTSQLGRRM